MSVNNSNVVKTGSSPGASKSSSRSLEKFYKARIEKEGSQRKFIRVRLTSADVKALDKCVAELVKSVKYVESRLWGLFLCLSNQEHGLC